MTFDISFSICPQLGAVGRQMEERLTPALRPDIIVLSDGHVGDGNVHVVANVPSAAMQPAPEISAIVYTVVREHGRSVSGEHGIGTRKIAYLGYSRRTRRSR